MISLNILQSIEYTLQQKAPVNATRSAKHFEKFPNNISIAESRDLDGASAIILSGTKKPLQSSIFSIDRFPEFLASCGYFLIGSFVIIILSRGFFKIRNFIF